MSYYYQQYKLLLLLLLLVLLGYYTLIVESATCPPQPSPQPLPSKLPIKISQAFQEITKIGSNLINNKTLPGLRWSVTYNGREVWSEGLGVKSKDSSGQHSSPDGDTVFRIGSVSKIFPVIMIYQLYEDGYIQSLDDPLKKYAPDFSIVNPFSKSDITLRQMASQMSGLQREAPCNDSSSGRRVLKQCQVSNEDILRSLRSEYLIHPPWTKPSYSNLAYALLGRLLVRLVDEDMSFEKYVQERILTPLQLQNTGFDITEIENKSKIAVGYNLDGSVAPLTDIGWEAPAGQMYSTTNDLNKLSSFFYEAYPLAHSNEAPPSHDDVLRADVRREMSLPYYINPDRETGFGTPWEIMYKGNYTIRTKGGNIDGYSALFSFIPELHLGVNALFSGEFETSIFAIKAFEVLLPPFVNYLSSLPPKLRYPPNPEAYIGTFQGGGVDVTIFSEAKTLYGRSSNRTEAMDYWGPNRLQIYVDESLYPCMDNELIGEIGEWIYFDSNYKDSKSPGFLIPGRFPGIFFKRSV